MEDMCGVSGRGRLSGTFAVAFESGERPALPLRIA
jgi:hypothetical protein